MSHLEIHRNHRVGWLRAAVLGANDGIVSTSSLVLGVAAAEAARGSVLTAGVAGLFAGAMSMAAGEYVSVSSQKDTEEADLAHERQELRDDAEHELTELTQIYVGRGVEPDLAKRVSEQMMEHDALAAHARDELGIFELTSARPIQAAVASAGTFAIGASLPLLVFSAISGSNAIPVVAAASLAFLAVLGILAARAGGASMLVGATRVTLWGALAMAITTAAGRIFGAMT